MNLDGHVNSLDAAIILQYDAGLISSLPQKPTPPPQATPTPNPTPRPPGTVLYQADWSQGANGWAGLFGWSWLNGQLLNDGSNSSNRNWIPAPRDPGQNDYAVEAEIQLTSTGSGCPSFGVVARAASTTQGFQGGPNSQNGFCDGPQIKLWTLSGQELTVRQFSAGNGWHTYRLEARANSLRLLVDGVELIAVSDNRYLTGGQVGLWSSGDQIAVRSFKVVAL